MAQTRIYPLDPDPPKAPEPLPAGVIARARRHPRLAFLAAVALTLGAAAARLRLGHCSHVEDLHLLPIALSGVLLPSPLAILVALLSLVLDLCVTLAGRSHQAPAAAFQWGGELAFALSAAVVLAVTMTLRRTATREGKQSRVLDGMRAVSAAIVSSLDLQRVLDTALTQAQRLTRADPVGIWLLDAGGEHLMLAACRARTPGRRVRADAAEVAIGSSHLLAECIRMRAVVVAAAHDAAGEPSAGFCLTGVEQAAAFPLVTHGIPVGVLAAGFVSKPDPEAPLVLRELANDAAVAIDNARLYAEAQRHVVTLEGMRAQAERRERQAQFLAEAGRLFTLSLDVRATMDAVVAKASELLGDACLILACHPDESPLRVAASFEGQRAIGRSLRQYLTDHPPRFGWGALGRAASTGQAQVARGDPANPGELGEYAVAVGLRGMIAVPLWGRGQVRGVFAAAYYDVERLPTDQDLQLATLLADRAAAAIENAELFEETQRAGMALEAWSHELERRVALKTDELHEVQLGLLRAERLASIGQLAATVAHELRNPLNVIKVAHYALQHGCSPERAARHLDAIERQVNAASRIIGDLLDFARESPPRLEPVDLIQLTQQILADRDVPQTVTVVTECGRALPVVDADRMQMVQVLSNIIENAFQMMPDGGTLVVRSFEEPGRVGLSVRDTGPGIPDEIRTRIFEPLFTTRTKGTGLGLAVARRIVEAHGGELRVENTSGPGATFTLLLPRPRAGAAACEEPLAGVLPACRRGST